MGWHCSLSASRRARAFSAPRRASSKRADPCRPHAKTALVPKPVLACRVRWVSAAAGRPGALIKRPTRCLGLTWPAAGDNVVAGEMYPSTDSSAVLGFFVARCCPPPNRRQGRLSLINFNIARVCGRVLTSNKLRRLMHPVILVTCMCTHELASAPQD